MGKTNNHINYNKTIIFLVKLYNVHVRNEGYEKSVYII